MIKQECIGIPDMILLLMIFCFKKIKIKAEIVLSPGGAYFLYIQSLPVGVQHVSFENFSSVALKHDGDSKNEHTISKTYESSQRPY